MRGFHLRGWERRPYRHDDSCSLWFRQKRSSRTILQAPQLLPDAGAVLLFLYRSGFIAHLSPREKGGGRGIRFIFFAAFALLVCTLRRASSISGYDLFLDCLM